MSNRCLFALLCMLFIVFSNSYAQEDSLKGKNLEEIILSANKWEQKLNEVPNKIIKINKNEIHLNNPQTSADLLGQTGSVFIQKSQLGGGSPMIRGFATNRVLLVADGVRMNNAIYRSGNLQNVISIDPLSIETAEVIFGPGSLIYGSDAIGGVMDFHTLQPRFSNTGKALVLLNFQSRYSTANNEKTVHADANLGWKKWSVLTSVSYSDFDDLKMGKNGGQNSYLRPEYVERQNITDVIVPNTNPRIQRFSGYDQLNFLQKISYKPTDFWNLQYSFTYAKTGNAPRYDRLIQYRNGALRFAEWHYGPMCWQVHSLQVLHSKKNSIYDKVRVTAAYQDYEESRIDRRRNSSNRNLQVEHVDALSLNVDATKALGKGELYHGVEYIYNKVGSLGKEVNIDNNSVSPIVSRYPNGSAWSTSSLYASYKVNLQPKITLSTGIRYSYNTLKASFDTVFIKFPYKKAEISDGAFTGNAGLVFRPAGGWQLNGNISSGYRMPNIDDIGKLFESTPGNLTIPNPGLKPEYAWNFEIGLSKNIINKFSFEISGFHTILKNAIVRRPTTLNGEDSILFDGVMSRVESLQNVAKATVWGIQGSFRINLSPNFIFQTNANWIKGKETDEENDEQVPLRHAPPFYGSSSFQYKKNKWFGEVFTVYNSQIKNKDLAPSEQSKGYMYASDKNGNPYSPGWYTVNLRASYQVSGNFQLTAGWENITNQRYRPYSSGIVAAGSNLIISIKLSF